MGRKVWASQAGSKDCPAVDFDAVMAVKKADGSGTRYSPDLASSRATSACAATSA
jgi:hypothetical protein